MPNEDNTRQLSNSNGQVITVIRTSEDRVAGLEAVVTSWLNDARKFERQMLAQFKEVTTMGAAVLEKVVTSQEDLRATTREELIFHCLLEKRIPRSRVWKVNTTDYFGKHLGQASARVLPLTKSV
jgi:hypothetical protein